jgi:hypothetical protein
MMDDFKHLIFGALLIVAVCGGPLYWTLMLIHFLLTGQK